MLGSVPDEGVAIVADLEAGIGTLTRLEEQAVDVTVVVVEPTPRSIDVARRAVAVADEQRQGHIVVAANKVTGPDDLERIAAAFPHHPVAAIPDDQAVDEADRLGVSPVDHDGRSPAVVAIEAMVDLIDPG